MAETRPDSRPLRPRRAVDADSEHFADGLDRGKVLIQRCDDCEALRHPPRPMCPHCRSFAWSTVAASGAGTIYSFTAVHYPAWPAFPQPNYVVLVELAEGVRMVGDLIGAFDPDRVRIGASVDAEIVADPNDDMLLVRWRLAEAGPA
ncbi:MAG: Zn-ribbon domain-containing OB-fold protein [Sphingobium sp.]